MRNGVFLSIVIPCYNEKENLQKGVLERMGKYLAKQKYTSEVIISDDGSTDSSLAFIENFLKQHQRFRLLKNPHAGKPFAVRSGVNQAKGNWVLFIDMDQSAPINQVEKFLPFFRRGDDVVIGSRGRKRPGFSFFRQLASDLFRLARQLLVLRELVDTQCGFKAFKTKVAQDLFSRLLIFKEAKKTKGWRVGAFDVELLFLAKKRGYCLAEVPIKWRDADISAGKKRNFFQESQEMLGEILRVKLNDILGRYQ